MIRILDTGTRQPDSIPDGIDLVHRPALIRQPLPVDAGQIGALLETAHHVVFYSQFAVRVVARVGVISKPGDHDFWAVGHHTARLLTESFDVTPRVPAGQRFSELRRVLQATDKRRPIVAFGLVGKIRDLSAIARRWSVDFSAIPVYESTPTAPESLREAFRAHRPHWLTVTSSRGARTLADALGTERLAELRRRDQLSIAAIGPSTAESLEELGLAPDLVPDEPGRTRLLEAIAAADGPESR